MDIDPTADSPLPAKTRTRLGELLGPRLAHNRFYQNKFQTAGCLGILPGSVGEFSARFPLTTKRELVEDQAAHVPYGSNLSFPIGHYVRCHQTSGTTGLPLRWLDTAESWSAMIGDWVTVLQKAGVTTEDRACFAFSFGPFLGFWLAFEAAGRLGVLSIAGGGMTSAQRARVIREQSCTVLCCTPTYALHLAEASRAEGLVQDSSTIRLVLVAGEPGGSLPIIRERISRAWNGARVFDHHGMTETGPVTYEHPDHPGDLVVMEESYLAEVIDPVTSAPVPLGSRGELVLTTLKRIGSPLIRYRTGDLVEARRVDGNLLLRGGILGRVDDMVVVRGVNVYPTALDSLIRSSASVGEYRVTVDRRSHLAELSVEIESEASEAAIVARRIQDSLALRVPVTAVPTGSLPRFELKARRWVTVG